ncbi:MAG TPA: glycine cleavage T C-terminal barrel domain-containing protein [Solirubrobacterales bacterium]|nr:glycine cleavage T C-terminal barrel domain-containing protein [Solirubrobacterales bacterium]
MAETATEVELDGQYRALREQAGFLVRDRAVLLVSGSDAAEYLQSQVTNDIEGLEPDQGTYAALLDRKGHLVADMRVLRLSHSHADQIWLDAEPVAFEALRKHLETYKIGREVEVADATAEWAITSVIGPTSVEAAGIPPVTPEHAQHYYERNGIHVLAVATDQGVDLITSPDAADTVREGLIAGGAEPVSDAAAEIVRVESGRPRFGLDMGPESMPAEAGIVERSVDFEKGCYIGQEPVARLHYRGKPNRTLRGLRLSAPATLGDPLVLGEREVGTVGTACISPALGPIALAIVRREAADGQQVTVGADGVSAELVELPFSA